MYSFIILTTGGDDYTSGTARITGLKENRSNRTDLIIPATVTDADGKVYTVTEIGDSAFTGNPWVTSIIVEEGIEILTGVPAGKKDKNGKFPAGTINDLVYKKLKSYAKINSSNEK